MKRGLSVAALAAVLFCATPAAADGPCTAGARFAVDGLGTAWDELVRAAELDGAVVPSPRLLRRGGLRTETLCADGPGLAWPLARALDPDAPLVAVPLRLDTVWNARYASGGNDGLLWAGRGASSMLSGGVAFRAGMFSGALAPAVAWSENRAFALPPPASAGDPYLNPWYGTAIDLPTRFGASPYATWSPGQSYLRADRWNVALGVSTENLWFGPGVRNAITMSNAGPGFPHVFVGTSAPADVGIGKAEALLFWGRLERSGYMPGATHPLVSGLVLDYAPRWVPGLSVGAARVFLQRWEDLQLRDWLAPLQSVQKKGLESTYPGGDNAYDNQLLSLFARWTFPESGLEVYGEWAREDHEWSFWGAIREPDHSQAYLLGLGKVWRAGARRVRLVAELTHLQELRPLDNERGVPVYYTHGNDLSYTNAGQLLGAWIGPGADSQLLAVDVIGPRGRVGGYLERVRRNDAVYWARDPADSDAQHDAELTAAARGLIFAGAVDVSWEAALSYRWNRDFVQTEPNARLVLGIATPTAARR
jgi:hypothetical protein